MQLRADEPAPASRLTTAATAGEARKTALKDLIGSAPAALDAFRTAVSASKGPESAQTVKSQGDFTR